MSLGIRIGLCLGLLLGLAKPIQAQREVLFSQYLQNPLSINPAYAGMRENFQLTAMLRRKWFSVRTAPVTQSVSMDGSVANGRIGLGFQAINDRMGLLQTTGGYLSAAYRLNLPALSHLSVGVQVGGQVLPFANAAVATNQFVPSVSVGVYYQSETVFGGISMPEVLTRRPAIVGQLFYPIIRPIVFNIGTKLPLAEETVLMPSVLLSKVPGRPVGYDLNAKLWIAEQIGLTASYRHNTPALIPSNYFHASAEYQLTPAIRVGYLYYSKTPESPLALQYYESSVHELMFRFSPGAVRFTY